MKLEKKFTDWDIETPKILRRYGVPESLFEYAQKDLDKLHTQEIQTAVQEERSDLISYLKKMLSNKMNDIVFSNWKAPIYALIGYLESTTEDTKYSRSILATKENHEKLHRGEDYEVEDTKDVV